MYCYDVLSLSIAEVCHVAVDVVRRRFYPTDVVIAIPALCALPGVMNRRADSKGARVGATTGAAGLGARHL